MAASKDPRTPLIAPRANSRRDTFRAAVEAVAGTNPVTGGLARLYQTTHPSKTSQDRAGWEVATTERVNEHGEQLNRHEGILAPTATIEGLPTQVIAQMIRDCPDGLGDE